MRLAVKITTFFAAFLLAALLVLRFWVLPHFQNSGSTMAALLITQAAIQFEKDHGKCPWKRGENLSAPPDVPSLISALRGENPSEKNYLEDFPESVFRDGAIVDSFGRPFRYTSDTDGFLTVTSAGANGRFGDSDDITSQPASSDPDPP